MVRLRPRMVLEHTIATIHDVEVIPTCNGVAMQMGHDPMVGIKSEEMARVVVVDSSSNNKKTSEAVDLGETRMPAEVIMR